MTRCHARARGLSLFRSLLEDFCFRFGGSSVVEVFSAVLTNIDGGDIEIITGFRVLMCSVNMSFRLIAMLSSNK